ncbi:MAG TPA: hypothetical protein VF544_21685 [Pyrinomonadaceae bacterium]|jgi:hypothetical protein
MDKRHTIRGEVRKTAAVIIFIFCLIGTLLIVVSVALPADSEVSVALPDAKAVYVALPKEHSLLKDLTRELGVVLLTVCGVSMIYELFVAERHFEKFLAFLHKQIERGESNAATCERLGIREIFTSRALYEAKYPLMQVADQARPGSPFRIIARSLYLVMNKPEAIKYALLQGANVELCCFDPASDSDVLSNIGHLEPSDITGALSTFRKEFVKWLEEKQPPGRIELRFHQIHVFDTFFSYQFDDHTLAAWDLSFGRDVTAKRIFIVEASKGLGADLHTRYEMMWNLAVPRFVYSNKTISQDELPH